MSERLSYDQIYERAQGKKDLYRSFGVPAVRAVLSSRYIRVVEGTENILDQPAIYMANHVHFFDSFLMALAHYDETDTPMRLIAKKEYFEGDGMGNGRFGTPLQFAISRTGQIPVDRDGGKTELTLFNKRIISALDSGDSVGIHPEGTRVSNGKLHKFQKGAASVAIQASVPMVPVAVSYHDTKNTRRSIARIQFGTPITPEEYTHGVYAALPRGAKVELTTRHIEDRVAQMLGLDEFQRTDSLARLKSMLHLPSKNDTK